ncbi:outer membrane beta-barrel protein [Tamlana sp. I1]|uniref:outer membrane beta-barrel protein n=1 Tax=Tamlana sp. I1 TaxID=2762061 RepID=UPI00188F96BB|nr:outer membrane beta-barrel protein [Tamlana sp. I1]
MKYKSFLVLVALLLCFVTKSFSQKGYYRASNGFGITGGLTQYDILTDNFTTKSSNGFLGGLRASVDLPHKWYNLSYGMQLSENNVEILGRPSLLSSENEYIKYKLLVVQLDFALHIKVYRNHFTIDVGPMLQHNGQLEFKEDNQKDYYVNNYTNLTAEDITDLSKFNVNGVIGASVGIRNFMLKAQYIYGFTNILNKLNTNALDTIGGESSFKGNQQMLVFAAIVTF